MKLTARESIIAFVTGILAVIGLTIVLGSPLIRQVETLKEDQRVANKNLAFYKEMASRHPKLLEQYGNLQVSLPIHKGSERVSSVLYPLLDNLVEKHQVNLTRRTVGKEVQEGELFETPITCDWDAPLDSLVNFLAELQTIGVRLNVKMLEVKPTKGNRLKGKFKINYVYNREDV
jgi:hypothetical protein